MSSRNKEMQARTEGMAYALKIARQGGIEELEKRNKFQESDRNFHEFVQEGFKYGQ